MTLGNVLLLLMAPGFSYFLGWAIPAQNEKPIGVCEVLKQLEVYNGKTVSVQAYIFGGKRHGYFLTDNLQQSRCPGMPSSKVTWPPSIFPVWPSDRQIEGGPVLFVRDDAAEHSLRQIMEELEAEETPKRLIRATFVGEVRTRGSITIFHEQDEDVYAGNGYGQFGMYPAQLVIKTIGAIEIS